MNRITKISGLAYLIIFVTGFYANFAVLESLMNSSSAYITTTNFIYNHSQFAYGIIGFVIMLFFDGLLVWLLFELTKSVNKENSLIASLFRLLHFLFFGIALFKLWKVYELTYNTSISEDLMHNITALLSDFDILWTIGLLFFGVHLIVLGHLVIKSKRIPKALGVLLMLAGLGYIIDGVAKLFMTNYSDYKDVFEVIVIMPAIIGEFSFTAWLLISGFKTQSSLQFKKKLAT